jgi:arabinan endo-1,5-alpha-L-arabinosidase
MESEGKLTRKIKLSSNLLAPAKFTVTVKESSNGAEKVFEVSGLDVHRNSITTIKTIYERSSQAYLNFFRQLGAEFDLHVPFKRTKPRPADTAVLPFQVVLEEKLSPDMVYGYGDPAVTKVFDLNGFKTSYYLLVSSYDAPDSFPILFSQDLANWTFKGFVFPKGKQPLWTVANGTGIEFRSAEVHLIGIEFRVYFVARHKVSRQLCIGTAKSLFPEGPYVAEQEPILSQNVVDPHVFVYDQETVYLFWKEDNNTVWPGLLAKLLYNHAEFIAVIFEEGAGWNTASFTTTLWPWIQTLEPKEHFMALQSLVDCITSSFYTFYQKLYNLATGKSDALKDEIYTILKYMKTPIYGQRLSPDGCSLVREKIKVIENDQEWEAHVVDGIWIARHEGDYLLFYAGNDVSSDQYGIGLAIAKAPLGPYVKYRRPIIQADQTDWAPGHPCIVVGPDGTSRLIMHGYYPDEAGYKPFQVLLSIPIRFSNNKVKLG